MHNLFQKSLGAINRLLRPFDAIITRKSELDSLNAEPTRQFTMPRMVRRLAAAELSIASVVDLGAAAGCWSQMAMSAFGSQQFLAVEALEEQRGKLEALRSANSRFNYTICAASETDSESLNLHVTDDLDGSFLTESSGAKSRTVNSRSLDSLVQEFTLPAPYFLKFDTHGAEEDILAGATDTLANTNLIVMEVYNFSRCRFPSMCQKLLDLGFHPFDIADPMLRPIDSALWQFDLAFVRSDHPSLVRKGYQ